MSDLTLRVSELFYSLQGEGARAGQPSLFVRLQGCSAKFACYASGVRCDTEFESGEAWTVQLLAARLLALQPHLQDQAGPGALERPEAGCRWIIWTGGEPLDQLTAAHVRYFAALGYLQALETSGVRPLEADVAAGLQWIVVSPKVAEHVLAKHFPHEIGFKDDAPIHVNELRYVRHAGQVIPQPALGAHVRCLSPHSDGQQVNETNLKHCLKLCLENPEWQLSVQQHKLWRVL